MGFLQATNCDVLGGVVCQSREGISMKKCFKQTLYSVCLKHSFLF